MVKFCPDCGNIMLPSKNNNWKRVFRCMRCGRIVPFDEIYKESYYIKQKIQHPVKEELLSTSKIEKWKNENVIGITEDFKCSRCGYRKARKVARTIARRQMGDVNYFLICMKCGKICKIEE